MSNILFKIQCRLLFFSYYHTWLNVAKKEWAKTKPLPGTWWKHIMQLGSRQPMWTDVHLCSLPVEPELPESHIFQRIEPMLRLFSGWALGRTPGRSDPSAREESKDNSSWVFSLPHAHEALLCRDFPNRSSHKELLGLQPAAVTAKHGPPASYSLGCSISF